MPEIILLTGRAAPLPGSDKFSGIDKHPVDHPLMLGPEGFESDEQADRRVHGGPEKAAHHYPRDHYAAWRIELGCEDMAASKGALPPGYLGMKEGPAVLDAPGAFGENISTFGMTERTVAVGDVFRLGQALVQVSQGRQPCWKLSRRFGVPDMARRVQDTGRTGWYYRVLEPGLVDPEDRIELVDRLAPDWTLHRLWHALYIDRMNLSELQGIAALELLAEGWRRHALRRLQSGRVEDWTKRLEGNA